MTYNSKVVISLHHNKIMPVIDVMISALNSFQNYRNTRIAHEHGFPNVLAAIHAEPPFKKARDMGVFVAGHFQTMSVLQLVVKCGTQNVVSVFPQDFKDYPEKANANLLVFSISDQSPEAECILNILRSATDSLSYTDMVVGVFQCQEKEGGELEPILSDEFEDVSSDDPILIRKDTFLIETSEDWINLDGTTGEVVYFTRKSNGTTLKRI